MKNFNKIKYEVLREELLDKKLKYYFRKIISIVGEEYAIVTLSTEETVKESITSFSRDFDDENDVDIKIALIKASLISNNYDSFSNSLVRKFVQENNINDLLEYIDTNYNLRRCLTKNYIEQCYETNLQTYEKRTGENTAISDLLILNQFYDEHIEKQLQKK
jgi:hypothetical protein